ncbi:hypothetical protein T05_14192, partial [Trichinella murrelli]
LINVRNTNYSSTCLLENVCKFLFHCYAYVYVALVSMVAGLRCAVRVRRKLWNIIENCFAFPFVQTDVNNEEKKKFKRSDMKQNADGTKGACPYSSFLILLISAADNSKRLILNRF